MVYIYVMYGPPKYDQSNLQKWEYRIGFIAVDANMQ